MKSVPCILLLIGIATVNYGQIRPDSLAVKLASTSERITIKSIDAGHQSVPDSLLPSFRQIDSIRNDFNLAADSIQTQYQEAISKVSAQSEKLNRSIDSLQRLNLPTGRLKSKMDSVNNLQKALESKFSSRLSELKAKTTAKFEALDLPLEYKEPLNELTKIIDGMDLGSDVIKIPELKIPGYTLPEIKGIGDLTSNAAEIGKIGDLPKLPGVETSAGDLGQVMQQAKAYQDDLRNITEGNLDDVEKLPEAIEQQAAKIDRVDELQKQSGIVDEHKAQLDELADAKNAKEKVTEVARKAAVNHFAGKEEQLKSAMEKISKYKQKYSSVSSIKDLPKRPPNPMKSKPFIERLVPGLYLQYQQKNFYLLDVNPYIGYKLTGRFTAGLGWNHRYAYAKDSRTFNSQSRIFGPRAYVDFKLGKGFIAHLEGESMNTFVPSTLRGNPDTGEREWVSSIMTGLKKEYKIYKNLKGTALIQYNLFNRYYKAPYVDRLNSRIGFEYVLKKSRKQKAQSTKR